MDPQNTRELSKDDFEGFLIKLGIFLSTQVNVCMVGTEACLRYPSELKREC